MKITPRYTDLPDPKALERASALLQAMLDDRISAGLRTRITAWFDSDAGDSEKFAALENLMHETLQPENNPSPLACRKLAELKRILKSEAVLRPRRIPLYRRAWFGVAAAAAVLAAVVVVGLLPDGAPPVPVAEVPQHTVEAIAEVQKEVVLADDTKIWINGGSKVTWPEDFDGGERRVKLQGEAFFEVAHNEGRPFYVHTEKLHVRVLGTKFNVSEGGAETVVTLHEGSVEVAVGDRLERIGPGERLTYRHDTGGLSVERIATLDDWRTDKMLATGKTIPEILRMIGNYYDVEILFDEALFTGERYSLGFNKKEPVESALEALSEAAGDGFGFKKQDGTIVIMNYKL